MEGSLWVALFLCKKTRKKMRFLRKKLLKNLRISLKYSNFTSVINQQTNILTKERDKEMENQEQFYQHELNCNGFVAMKYTEEGKTIVSVYDPYQDFKLLGHYPSFVEAHRSLC